MALYSGMERKRVIFDYIFSLSYRMLVWYFLFVRKHNKLRVTFFKLTNLCQTRKRERSHSFRW